MKIAVVTDELYPIHTFVLDWLKSQGHEPILFGALQSNQDEVCTEGIFFCWTGTGISMAANKVPGIRAALCTDAETARGARIWNHANVLALSNRLLSQDVSKEILTAWFEDYDAAKGAKGVAELRDLESSIT
jgi:ribose 5-phosphate isomerase B